jgi:hypothetical protein
MYDVANVYDALSYAKDWELKDQIANLAADSAFIAGVQGAVTITPAVVAFYMMYHSVVDADQQVLDLVKNENTQTGFSQGVIMGMLGWKWSQVDRLFVRHHVLQIYERQDLNDLWVSAYNLGLRLGYHHAAQLSPGARKGYLTATRRVSRATAGAWTQRDQINYVIDLAGAFRKLFMPFWGRDETGARLGD